MTTVPSLLTGRGIAGLLGTTLPIIQAPMAGGITTPALVAAVCEAGGLGSLAAPLLSPARLLEDVAAIRALTGRPFAVNLFVLDEPDSVSRVGEAEAIERLSSWRARYSLPPPVSPARLCESFLQQLDALEVAAPAVASFHFGIPPVDRIRRLQQRGVRVIGTATNVAEARAWAQAGADAIVAQGAEAGGHRGTFLGERESGELGTLALVPQLVDATPLPVIAAGGIMDGRGIAAALALGASGVQMGTAFLACDESGAHEVWKLALAQAQDRGTRLTRLFSGRWARGLVNGFMQTHRADEQAVPPYPLQNALTAELRSAAARQSDPEGMSLWAGQAAAMAQRLPAAQLVDRLHEQTLAAMVALQGR